MADPADEELLSKLQPFLVEWKHRLYLDSWETTLEVDNTLEDAWACVGVCVPMHSASISIRDPAKAPPGWKGGGDDIEQSLVHELLHIVNAGYEKALRKIPKKFGVFDQYEAALELTSRALVAAKRGEPKL